MNIQNIPFTELIKYEEIPKKHEDILFRFVSIIGSSYYINFDIEVHKKLTEKEDHKYFDSRFSGTNIIERFITLYEHLPSDPITVTFHVIPNSMFSWYKNKGLHILRSMFSNYFKRSHDTFKPVYDYPVINDDLYIVGNHEYDHEKLSKQINESSNNMIEVGIHNMHEKKDIVLKSILNNYEKIYVMPVTNLRSYISIFYGFNRKPKEDKVSKETVQSIFNYCLNCIRSERVSFYKLFSKCINEFISKGYTKYVVDRIKDYQNINFIKASNISRMYDFDIIIIKKDYNYMHPKTILIDLKNCHNIDNDIALDHELNKIKSELNYYDQSRYSALTDKIKISLLFSKKYSRAYYKLMEIFIVLKYHKEKSVLKALHTCEAPGMWIVVAKNYCKKYNIEYDWDASTLEAISHDTYGLIKKYPEKWKYRDILSVDYIKEIYGNDYNLFTSDVGILNDEWKDQEDVLKRLQIFSFLAGLSSLSIGGDLIIKCFLPSKSNELKWLHHTASNNFKYVYAIKPSLNPSSSEYYFVCFGLKIKYTLYEILDIINNNTFSEFNSVFKRKDLTPIMENNIKWIARNIMVYQNPDLLPSQFLLQQKYKRWWDSNFSIEYKNMKKK